MVQGSGDIEQDLKEILDTRLALTEKIEALKIRLRNAVRETQLQVQSVMDEVKGTAESIKRTFSPSYQMDRHPWAVMSGVILIGYMLGMFTTNADRERGNGHLLRQTRRFLYDLLKKAIPGRA